MGKTSWRFLQRLAVLGVLLGTAFSTLAPAFAQAPPAVPALPDSERRTSYSLSSSTCPACSVGFALYGDGTDYGSWIEVWLISGSGTSTTAAKLTAVTDYTLSSVTGSLASIPRPITNATITLATARTGTLQIVGARRPRRTTQFTENRGVAARDLNQTVTDLVAENRELWDKMGRALITAPGDTIGSLPAASVRAGGIACYDGSGNPLVCAPGSAGTANVVGPNVSVVGHIPVFANTAGTLLADGGLIGTGNVIGPSPSVSAANHAVTWKDATGLNVIDSGLTLTPSTGTLTVTNAKALSVTNTITLSGTDGTTMTFPTTSATIARTDAANTFTGHQTIEGVTSTGATGTGRFVFDGSPTLITPNLGTPSAATLTNATGLPIATGVSGLGTGVATFLATPSSANLASALTDETGSGAAVFATSPTLVTPSLGTPSALTLTNATGLPLSGIVNTVAAYSIVGNFTASPASPTASAIGGLTQKVSPAASDLVMIQDQAAGGQPKYALVSSLSSAGSVATIDGKTGTFTTGNGLDSTGGNVIELTAARRTLPTKQVFTSSSGTYNTPANVLWIEITLAGGGGGGSGGNNTGPSAAAASCWNTSGPACSSPVYSAGGGGAGNAAAPGAGGTISGSGTCDWSVPGGGGGAGVTSTASANSPGGTGGNSSLGGGGSSTSGSTGGNGATNSGAGGGGGGVGAPTVANGGGGGGAGATCRVVINSPAASYTYAVGAGTNGSAGGSGGGTGGNGAAGIIIVTEHYGT